MTNQIRIKLNNSKENQEKGFYTLVTSGTSVFSNKKDEFTISPKALDILKERKIHFELISH